MSKINLLLKDSRWLQILRFVAIGGLATITHYLIYMGFLYINLSYNISYGLGYFLSFIFNYFASNYFTFKTEPSVKNGLRFIIAHLINFTLQIVLLNGFISLGINEGIAPFLVFMIAVPVNYVMVKAALK